MVRINLKKDRQRKAKIVLPREFSRMKTNRARTDTSGYDTLKGARTKPKYLVRVGVRGGKYVIIKGKKRYLKS